MKKLIFAALLLWSIADYGQESIFLADTLTLLEEQRAVILERPFSQNGLNYFVNVGNNNAIKIMVDHRDVEFMAKFMNAINIATDVGLLTWERVDTDTSAVYKSYFHFYIEDRNNSFTLGIFDNGKYYAKKGEIMVGNHEEIWKAKNEDLLIFLRKYFFGF